MRLFSLLGNSQKLDGGAMFGNAPKALWKRWVDVDDANRIDLACRCLLIEDGPRLILCETGIGAFFEPKLKARFGVVEDEHVLLTSLAERGVDQGDITDVVLSHLHFDHAGGLLSPWSEGEASKLLFPRARFHVSRGAWERAKSPHMRDRASFIPELSGLLEASGRLRIIEPGAQPDLGPAFSVRLSEGHTPGLMLLEVAGARDRVVFMGDLVPGAPWVHLPITMGYDRYPERLIEEKEAILGDLADTGGWAFFTHDSKVAMARVGRDDRGRLSAVDAQVAVDGFEL